MSKLKETLFAGRDNAIRLLISEGAVALRAAYPTLTPTRWVLTIHSETPLIFDSADDYDLFVWDAASSVLEVRIGPEITPDAAASQLPATLVMYSAEFPRGAVLVHPSCTPDRLSITICGNS